MVDSLSKIYSFFSNGYKKIKEYNAKGVFAILITMFLTLNILSLNYANAYDATIDSQKTYQENSKTQAHYNQDPLNSDEALNSTFVGLLMTGIETGCSSCMNNNDLVLKDSTISQHNKGGVIEFIDSQNMALFRSVPTVNIPANLANNWIPGYKEANSGIYAATDGYSFLSEIGIDALWERTSLIAYVLFVIVLIVAGFMIMLRQKIGGQVAITVFNALPNVIMGLILVPFSFAIIGLILNISMIGTNVIAGILGATDPVIITSPVTLVGELLWGGQVFEEFWNGTGVGLAGSFGLTGAITGALAATVGTAGGAAIGLGVALLILFLILVAVVAYASFRVYMTLLSAYLAIIIDVIMAPLIIAFGSIPGQENMTMNLFKRVLKNALVFPGVFLFINLSAFILQDNINISFPYGLASGNWADGGTAAGATGAILQAFLAIGMFFLAAEVPNFLADFIPVEGGKGAASAIEGAKKAASKIPIVGSFIG